MDEYGVRIDEIPLDHCFGRAKVVESTSAIFPHNVGLIFREGDIDVHLYEQITEATPLFVVIGDDATLSIALEKQLLQDGILTYTDLINLSELPDTREVIFFGIPLKIKGGDGSPIRAFAVVE
jgi:kynurenine formamidase